MSTRGALKNKMVDPNAKYIEPIHTSINKICREVTAENEVRANMEKIKNKSSEARGTVDVIEHIINSNQGRARAILGIKDGIESASKEPGRNTGVDIVKILSEGARLGETHLFVLQGVAQDCDNQVTYLHHLKKRKY